MIPQRTVLRCISSFALVLCSLQMFAQTTTWYFGDHAGLDFSKTPPQVISGPIKTDEGSAVVTNPQGRVLFSTDGTHVFNAQGIVVNSSLKGDNSSTHSAIIIPHPKNPCQRFFVFTVGSADTISHMDGLHVTEVLTKNGNISVSAPLKLANNVTEKLAATDDGQGGYWLVAHDYDTSETPSPGKGRSFYAYHVTHTSSVNNLLPKTSKTGSWHGGVSFFSGNYHNTVGQMKFSKEGNLLALTIYEDEVVDILGFNKQNGDIYKIVTIDDFGGNSPEGSLYGVEFSPNANNLYITTGFMPAGDTAYVWGMNLEVMNANAIWKSRKRIRAEQATEQVKYPFGGLQLGPDDQIYIARRDKNYLSSIVNSNELLHANYRDTAIVLQGTCKLSLPTTIKTTDCSVGTWPCSGFSLELHQDTVVCAGDSVEIGLPEQPGIRYRWNTGATTSLIWGHPGNQYFLRITDSIGCRSEDTINLRFPPEIKEEVLPDDTSFCKGHGTELSFREEGFQITWNKDVTREYYTVEDDGFIPYIVYNQCDTILNGLQAKINDCTCQFEVPNAFTPNDDGLNDYFEIKIPCELEYYKLSIFDRWGKKVFESHNQWQYWDGETTSGSANTAVYVYILHYKAAFDETRKKQSHVTVLR